MAPRVHADAKARTMTPDSPTGQIDQPSIIIDALKEEIGRSQEILLNRIMQLEEKCNAVDEQQAALQWKIGTQIVPYMSTMSELLIDVCEQLATAKIVTLTDQQQTKIHRLRHPPRTAQVPFSLLFCFFFFFSMNLDANEFFPSNETTTRSPTINGEYLLSTVLKTDFQRETAPSIIREWNTATTLSALTREWSNRHENRPTKRNSFSLLLYNISSLRIDLEDHIDYISESYPNI